MVTNCLSRTSTPDARTPLAHTVAGKTPDVRLTVPSPPLGPTRSLLNPHWPPAVLSPVDPRDQRFSHRATPPVQRAAECCYRLVQGAAVCCYRLHTAQPPPLEPNLPGRGRRKGGSNPSLNFAQDRQPLPGSDAPFGGDRRLGYTLAG